MNFVWGCLFLNFLHFGAWDILNLFLFFFLNSSWENLRNNFRYYSVTYQYWFSLLFESIKLLLNESNKNFELCQWTQAILKQLLELLRNALLSRSKYVFDFFRTKKSMQSDVFNFQKVSAWIILSMLLHFC